MGSIKRHVILEIIKPRRLMRLALLARWMILLGLLRALLGIALALATAHAFTATTAIEHLHFTGDNLGGVAIGTGIFILPLTGYLLARNVDFATLF